MSNDTSPRDPESPEAEGSGEAVEPDGAEWQRRRRLAAVFGDVLPDTTSDERDAESARDDEDGDAKDRWLRGQVPPHHG
jgi:hypothetical protein